MRGSRSTGETMSQAHGFPEEQIPERRTAQERFLAADRDASRAPDGVVKSGLTDAMIIKGDVDEAW